MAHLPELLSACVAVLLIAVAAGFRPEKVHEAANGADVGSYRFAFSRMVGQVPPPLAGSLLSASSFKDRNGNELRGIDLLEKYNTVIRESGKFKNPANKTEEMANRLLSAEEYELKDFFDDCSNAFPELGLFFIDNEPSSSGLRPFDEYQRTIGALFAVYWLIREDKSGFSFGYDAHWHRRTARSVPDEKRSGFEQDTTLWNKFFDLVSEAGCKDPARVAAMLSLTSFHDVMKIERLLPTVASGTAPYLGFPAGAKINDHDMALSYVLEHHPNLVPSYDSLASDDGKAAIMFSQGKLNFNHGWFVQAEGTPGAMLHGFKAMVTMESAPDRDVAFYFLHWFTDLAGAEAKPLEGAEKFVLRFPKHVTQSFLSSIPFLEKLAQETETQVNQRYLQARWADNFPTAPPTNSIAKMRLAVMAQDGSQQCIAAFEELANSREGRDDIRTLETEMSKTGLEQQEYKDSDALALENNGLENGPAFLVYYGPQLLQAFRNEDMAKFQKALKVLAEVYRKARAIFPASPGRKGETVTIRIDELKAAAVQANNLAEFLTTDFNVVAEANGKEGKVQLVKKKK
eukprot:TRINITY_DN25918_c0_g1_i1.p1 TRINITY_DN25918_c0_g1~~TRINITY_DN25918_c0_g1_i1.p1  ORF type:complete len:572 (-),score=110.77 TRINITY_DN25918_c0_g1_i1:94-1809(-)